MGHFTDSDVVLDFVSRAEHPRLAVWARPARTTSCARRCARWFWICRDRRPRSRKMRSGSESCTLAYRDGLCRVLRAPCQRESNPADARCGPGDRAGPGVGMFSFGANKQTARVAGEFYVNAINVMRGAEALSTYAPIDESEKFRIEYWALEEAKLQRMPKTKAAGDPGGVRHRWRLRHRQARSPIALRQRARAWSSRTAIWRAREQVAAEIGSSDVAVAVAVDVTDEGQIAAAMRQTLSRVRRRRPGGQQRGTLHLQTARSRPPCSDWDIQHDVMARGSFLVSREAARVLAEQASVATSSTSQARTRSSPAPTTSRTAPPRPTRRTRCGCSPPSSGRRASGSTG